MSASAKATSLWGIFQADSSTDYFDYRVLEYLCAKDYAKIRQVGKIAKERCESFAKQLVKKKLDRIGNKELRLELEEFDRIAENKELRLELEAAENENHPLLHMFDWVQLLDELERGMIRLSVERAKFVPFDDSIVDLDDLISDADPSTIIPMHLWENLQHGDLIYHVEAERGTDTYVVIVDGTDDSDQLKEIDEETRPYRCWTSNNIKNKRLENSIEDNGYFELNREVSEKIADPCEFYRHCMNPDKYRGIRSLNLDKVMHKRIIQQALEKEYGAHLGEKLEKAQSVYYSINFYNGDCDHKISIWPP